MSQLRFFSVILLLLICLRLSAAETDTKTTPTWLLSAAAFDVSALPAVKKGSGVLVPQLILESLEGTFSHYPIPEEMVATSSNETRDSRVKAIKSLQTLYEERDALFFKIDSSVAISKKYSEVNKKITDAEEVLTKTFTESEETGEDTVIDVADGDTKSIPVSFWKKDSKTSGGYDLAAVQMKEPIAPQLSTMKIDGLITGEIEPVGSYVYISVSLYIYPLESPVITVSDAGSWEMLTEIVDSIAIALLPSLYGKIPAVIAVSPNPIETSAYMDGNPIKVNVPFSVAPGKHFFEFKAPAHYSTTAFYTFEPGKKYRISARLEEQPLRIITYGKPESQEMVIIEGFDPPIHDSDFAIPYSDTIGYVEAPDQSNAWFIIPEVVFGQNMPNARYEAQLNPPGLDDVITRRRNIMYWSLGVLYLFLPINSYFNGAYDNMQSAYASRAIGDTVENIEEINRMATISNITTGITIGLFVNFAVHLVRYIIAADRLSPRMLKPEQVFSQVMQDSIKDEKTESAVLDATVSNKTESNMQLLQEDNYDTVITVTE